MNKKFLSAILFGALMVTSTGTFVSCKDYDDEIEELRGQINNLATKSDVEAKLSQLQAAIDAAKAESAANASKLAALEKCECDVDAMLAKVKESVDADMAAYKTELEALIAQAEALVGKIADFVTSVELNHRGYNVVPSLNFYTITEKENVFEDGLTGAIPFEEGKQTITGMTPVVVRVSPTNAMLAPEMISLVNSKGENLDEYVELKVEKYNDLLSRTATNNGLWKITPVLKKYDPDQFAAMKYVDVEKGDVWNNRIAYALQINNALESAEARYVTSEYSILMGVCTPFEARKTLTFKVDNEKVDDLNNRYTYEANKSLKNFTAPEGLKMYQELTWYTEDSKKYPIPAVEAIKKDGKWMNAATDEADNRADGKLFLAVQGKKFTVAISDYSEENEYAADIAGLYVTLDKEANAVESAPSEWNAWNKYTITGLDTVVEGTSIDITIDSEETINDIIGFRVYAVNLDGTLVDPDGRAFYVLVGEQAAETQTVTATITPTNAAASRTSVKVALTDAQSAVISKLEKDGTKGKVTMAEEKVVAVDAEGNKYPVEYDVTFEKKDGKAIAAVFTLVSDIKNMINDKTYKASVAYTTSTGHIMGEVNFELTKAMPNVFPADFAFRPKQETTEGSGKFIAYMIPASESYVVAEAYATNGIKDLNNVFYGLDQYYAFEFANSDTDKDKKLIEVAVAANEDKEYILNVKRGYIDNTTPHAVSVWYTYPGISTYSYTKDGKEVWAIGDTWKVEYDKALEATYACWEDASAFAWGTTVVDKATVSLKPVLQWTAEGVERSADLAAVVSTNSYNNDYFGLDLESLLNTKGWLKIATKDAADKAITTIQLTVGEQVNPYYVPSIVGSKIIFKQAGTQVDAAPTADHEETLVITLVDAFGHQVPMSLPVTVKAPEKK